MLLEHVYIEKFAQYLEDNGLSNLEVQDDVLDHMCIELENLIDEGQSLDSAMALVQSHFTPKVIANIERDTQFYLTIKNKSTMIKGIFISGYVVVCLLALSLGTKQFFAFFTDQELSMMLASLLNVTAATVFCFVFLPLLFKFGYRKFMDRLFSV